MRYRDDILIIGERHHASGWQEFVKILQSRVRSIYQLKVEGSYNDGCSFLDVYVWVPSDYQLTGKLQYRLFQKPTQQKRPLGSFSAHTPAVHRAWPAGQIRRIALRSGSYSDFVESKKQFIHWLRHHFINPDVTDRLETMNTFSFSIPPKSRDSNCVWLVLPFHPDLSRVRWTSLIEQCTEQLATWFRSSNMPMPRIRIAWRNSLKSVGYHMRRLFNI